jgi:hypothetical protein
VRAFLQRHGGDAADPAVVAYVQGLLSSGAASGDIEVACETANETGGGHGQLIPNLGCPVSSSVDGCSTGVVHSSPRIWRRRRIFLSAHQVFKFESALPSRSTACADGRAG